MKKVLTAPISAEDIAELRAGDIIYLSGAAVTGRDSVHHRFLVKGEPLPENLRGGILLHAGPIMRKADGEWQMLAGGPTTSMRMEKFEAEFIEKSGVRVLVGKGGMGEATAAACKQFGAVHCVFPAGCAVLAAQCVAQVRGVKWEDLAMPEAMWLLTLHEYGPLIVSIDAQGNNLFAGLREGMADKLAAAKRAVAAAVR